MLKVANIVADGVGRVAITVIPVIISGVAQLLGAGVMKLVSLRSVGR